PGDPTRASDVLDGAVPARRHQGRTACSTKRCDGGLWTGTQVAATPPEEGGGTHVEGAAGPGAIGRPSPSRGARPGSSADRAVVQPLSATARPSTSAVDTTPV